MINCTIKTETEFRKLERFEPHIYYTCHEHGETNEGVVLRVQQTNEDLQEGDPWVEYRKLIMKDTSIHLQVPPLKASLLAKFGSKALTKAEIESKDYPLILPGLFFRRLCTMLGIVLNNPEEIYRNLDEVLHERRKGGDSTCCFGGFEFMDPHLIDLGVRRKHMHLVDACHGKALWSRAAKAMKEINQKYPEAVSNSRDKHDKRRVEIKKLIPLVQLAQERLAVAATRIADDLATLYALASAELWLGTYTGRQYSDKHGEKKVIDNMLENAGGHVNYALQLLGKRSTLSEAEKKKYANFEELKFKITSQCKHVWDKATPDFGGTARTAGTRGF